MVDFRARAQTFIKEVSLISPLITTLAGCSALAGFIYAKFSALPPLQVAKAMAIWTLADAIFLYIAETFNENKSAKRRRIIMATVFTASMIAGIQQMQQRGLIGPKMTIFLIVARSCFIGESLIKALYSSSPSTP